MTNHITPIMICVQLIFMKLPKQDGGFIYEEDQLPVLVSLARRRCETCETHLFVDPSRPRLHTCFQEDLRETFQVTGTIKESK